MRVSKLTLLAPRDAAKRLGLSTSRLAQLDREGQLPAERDSSGRRLYDAETIAEFARKRAESPKRAYLR